MIKMEEDGEPLKLANRGTSDPLRQEEPIELRTQNCSLIIRQASDHNNYTAPNSAAIKQTNEQISTRKAQQRALTTTCTRTSLRLLLATTCLIWLHLTPLVAGHSSINSVWLAKDDDPMAKRWSSIQESADLNQPVGRRHGDSWMPPPLATSSHQNNLATGPLLTNMNSMQASPSSLQPAIVSLPETDTPSMEKRSDSSGDSPTFVVIESQAGRANESHSPSTQSSGSEAASSLDRHWTPNNTNSQVHFDEDPAHQSTDSSRLGDQRRKSSRQPRPRQSPQGAGSGEELPRSAPEQAPNSSQSMGNMESSDKHGNKTINFNYLAADDKLDGRHRGGSSSGSRSQDSDTDTVLPSVQPSRLNERQPTGPRHQSSQSDDRLPEHQLTEQQLYQSIGNQQLVFGTVLRQPEGQRPKAQPDLSSVLLTKLRHQEQAGPSHRSTTSAPLLGSSLAGSTAATTTAHIPTEYQAARPAALLNSLVTPLPIRANLVPTVARPPVVHRQRPPVGLKMRHNQPLDRFGSRSAHLDLPASSYPIHLLSEPQLRRPMQRYPTRTRTIGIGSQPSYRRPPTNRKSILGSLGSRLNSLVDSSRGAEESYYESLMRPPLRTRGLRYPMANNAWQASLPVYYLDSLPTGGGYLSQGSSNRPSTSRYLSSPLAYYPPPAYSGLGHNSYQLAVRQPSVAPATSYFGARLPSGATAAASRPYSSSVRFLHQPVAEQSAGHLMQGSRHLSHYVSQPGAGQPTEAHQAAKFIPVVAVSVTKTSPRPIYEPSAQQDAELDQELVDYLDSKTGELSNRRRRRPNHMMGSTDRYASGSRIHEEHSLSPDSLLSISNGIPTAGPRTSGEYTTSIKSAIFGYMPNEAHKPMIQAMSLLPNYQSPVKGYYNYQLEPEAASSGSSGDDYSSVTLSRQPPASFGSFDEVSSPSLGLQLQANNFVQNDIAHPFLGQVISSRNAELMPLSRKLLSSASAHLPLVGQRHQRVHDPSRSTLDSQALFGATSQQSGVQFMPTTEAPGVNSPLSSLIAGASTGSLSVAQQAQLLAEAELSNPMLPVVFATSPAYAVQPAAAELINQIQGEQQQQPMVSAASSSGGPALASPNSDDDQPQGDESGLSKGKKRSSDFFANAGQLLLNALPLLLAPTLGLMFASSSSPLPVARYHAPNSFSAGSGTMQSSIPGEYLNSLNMGQVSNTSPAQLFTPSPPGYNSSGQRTPPSRSATRTKTTPLPQKITIQLTTQGPAVLVNETTESNSTSNGTNSSEEPATDEQRDQSQVMESHGKPHTIDHHHHHHHVGNTILLLSDLERPERAVAKLGQGQTNGAEQQNSSVADQTPKGAPINPGVQSGFDGPDYDSHFPSLSQAGGENNSSMSRRNVMAHSSSADQSVNDESPTTGWLANQRPANSKQTSQLKPDDEMTGKTESSEQQVAGKLFPVSTWPPMRRRTVSLVTSSGNKTLVDASDRYSDRTNEPRYPLSASASQQLNFSSMTNFDDSPDDMSQLAGSRYNLSSLSSIERRRYKRELPEEIGSKNSSLLPQESRAYSRADGDKSVSSASDLEDLLAKRRLLLDQLSASNQRSEERDSWAPARNATRRLAATTDRHWLNESNHHDSEISKETRRALANFGAMVLGEQQTRQPANKRWRLGESQANQSIGLAAPRPELVYEAEPSATEASVSRQSPNDEQDERPNTQADGYLMGPLRPATQFEDDFYDSNQSVGDGQRASERSAETELGDQQEGAEHQLARDQHDDFRPLDRRQFESQRRQPTNFQRSNDSLYQQPRHSHLANHEARFRPSDWTAASRSNTPEPYPYDVRPRQSPLADNVTTYAPHIYVPGHLARNSQPRPKSDHRPRGDGDQDRGSMFDQEAGSNSQPPRGRLFGGPTLAPPLRLAHDEHYNSQARDYHEPRSSIRPQHFGSIGFHDQQPPAYGSLVSRGGGSYEQRGGEHRSGAAASDQLKRVQFSDSDRDKLMASYLTCDGLLNDNDHCLERLSCEFSDPVNIERANKLDRAVSSILLGHILINTYIPDQFKLRLKSASLYGYTQSGRCSHYACNKLARPN